MCCDDSLLISFLEMLVGLFFSRMSHVFTRQDATDLSKIVLIAAYVQIQYEITEELEEI